jgi:gas vesicle protein
MSDKDNFGTGFILGTVIGGVVGGVIGTIIANQTKDKTNKIERESNFKINGHSSFDNKDEIENARLSLEDKINQLNHAIDDVRVTLMKNTESSME